MAEPAAPAEDHAPSPTGGLAIAAAIVAFGFLGSRVLGVLRTTVIAWRFGSGPELDAYNVAFRVPDLIFQVLAGATLGSAFIPVFTRLHRRESELRAWELASSILNLVTMGEFYDVALRDFGLLVAALSLAALAWDRPTSTSVRSSAGHAAA